MPGEDLLRRDDALRRVDEASDLSGRILVQQGLKTPQPETVHDLVGDEYRAVTPAQDRLRLVHRGDRDTCGARGELSLDDGCGHRRFDVGGEFHISGPAPGGHDANVVVDGVGVEAQLGVCG